MMIATAAVFLSILTRDTVSLFLYHRDRYNNLNNAGEK
jgi:hypothetical protein